MMNDLHRTYKPYGRLYSQGKEYLLLNPQPIPHDSCWRDNAYQFFVAEEVHGRYFASTIIATQFLLHFDSNQPSIQVSNVVEDETEGETEDEMLTSDEMWQMEQPVPDDWRPLSDDTLAVFEYEFDGPPPDEPEEWDDIPPEAFIAPDEL